jgi:hypothetical protein
MMLEYETEVKTAVITSFLYIPLQKYGEIRKFQILG